MGRDFVELQPVQYNLAGVPLLHNLETFFEFRVVIPVCDHGRDIQSAFEHDRHFVPRLIHFAAVDSLDGQHIEDHEIPIDGDRFGWDAEDGNFSAMAHRFEHGSEGCRCTGHFESHIEAFLQTEFFLDIGHVARTRVESDGCTHAAREVESKRVEVRDHHMSSACMFHDRGSHESDGSGSGDQNIFAQAIEAQRGVNCIPERIKDGSDVTIDVIVMMPDVGHRQRDVFGERARSIHTDSLCILAQMSSACEAISAAAAYDVSFAGDDFAREEVLNIRTHFDDFADEFMADHHRYGNRLLGPCIPVVDVQIGAADPCLFDPDQHVIDTDCGKRNILEFQAATAMMLYQSFHELFQGD